MNRPRSKPQPGQTLLRQLLLLVIVGLLALPAQAHQLGMALFQLSAEGDSGRRWVLHTELPLGGRRQAPAIGLQPPVPCTADSSSLGRMDDRLIRKTRYDCGQSWFGRTLRIVGLDPQTPDALVQVNLADGQQQFHSIKRQQGSFPLGTGARPPAVMRYFGLGLEHIAGGWDHLLFVALLYLCCAGRQLLLTVTGFTLAHALSLSSILLGGIRVAAPPVEALIALSIALLAAELLRQRAGAERTLALRYPVLMAFAFGLLHGLGFADALRQLGLPAQAEWQALLLFNLGIECGQLLLLGGLLAAAWVLRRLRLGELTGRLQPALLYAIGSTGMFWAWQRLL